ncbi:MAG: CoA ester lyase [Hyphomicrobiales bacterium]|nr:CoA ester lyase [Hyphomicrobiales bacterium]
MQFHPRRSALYMPGSNARALEKAKTLPADVLILDLEDSVAPGEKEAARRQLEAAVRNGGYGKREIVIRVNALSTPWGVADMKMAARSGADAVLLPKVETPADIAAARLILRAAGADNRLTLWAMMETPRAMLNVGQIAAARTGSPELQVFVLGTNDLTKETGATLTNGRMGMIAWLSTCVAAAKAHGLDVIDGVYNAIGDEAGLHAELEQGQALGMTGKTLIHPSQIASCNAVFTPPADEIEWAREVIAAFSLPENSGKGVLTIDGKMVERLHAEMASRTVAIAEAIAELEGPA